MTLRRYLPGLFFALVAVLMFWKAIFHPEFTLLSGGDTAVAYYPWFDVAAHWLERGIFLLWDPYVYAGKVNMGEPQPGLFYPLNWLFMLLHGPGGGVSLTGMQALMLLDYFLAGLFFYRMARSFGQSPCGASVAGIAWAFGGYTAQLYGYLNVLSGFVWFPLAVLYFRKALSSPAWRSRLRYCLCSGIFLALSFLPGHHIPPVHIGLFLLFYAVFALVRDWNRSGWSARMGVVAALGLVAATAVLLTALQWLPSAEWAQHVYRWVGEGPPLTWGQQVPYSRLQHSANLNPQDVVSLVLPYVSTDANLYTGFILFFLALVGILFVHGSEARFIALSAFLYLFLSWGRFSALHGWVNTFIPGVWFAREVFYYLVIFQACLALLAGWGLDCLVQSHAASPDSGLRRFLRRAGWTMAIVVAGSFALIAVLYIARDVPIEHPYFKALAGLAVYVSALGILLFLMETGRISASLFRLLTVAIIIVDLSSRISDDLQPRVADGSSAASLQEYWKKPPSAEFLKALRQKEHFRVDDPLGIFPPNFGDAWRLDATMGHGATGLVDYFRFRGVGWGPGSNASALLNVRYLPSPIALPGLPKVFGDGVAVYRNARAVPRAFVVSRYRGFADRAAMLDWIRGPLMTPREIILLDQSDVDRLPNSFLSRLIDDDEGIDLKLLAKETAAEKRAATVLDQKQRHEALLLQPAWGWSAGDRVTIAVHPRAPAETVFLVLEYYPGSPQASRLKAELLGPGGGVEVPIELPGLDANDQATGRPRRVAVDLGRLEDLEYKLSLAISEECPAKVDSLRITRSVPPISTEDAGNVSIVSHKPNRILLSADIKRNAFVLLSEVYFPGWEATVDGRPAPVLRADYILRGVPVEPGKHTIELRYRSKIFLAGLAVSACSGLAVLIILAAPWWREGQRNTPQEHGRVKTPLEGD